MKLENLRKGQVAKIRRELSSIRDSLRTYEIETATKTGSISTLETLRTDLVQKNRQLEEQIESLNSKTAFEQQSLSADIKKRENEIAVLKKKLAAVNQLLADQEIEIGTLTGDLRTKMEGYRNEKYELISSRQGLSLVINEDILFMRGSVSKLSTEGVNMLKGLIGVINNYPAMNIEVIGHTDDSKPSTGYTDNWTISVIRAVGVLRVLQDAGVSPNQIVAVGNGEYQPMASNSSAEGRDQNRRVEIRFTPSQQVLSQKIKKAIQ